MRRAKGLGRCVVVAALAVGASGAVAAPGSPRTLSVRITAPAPALTGAPCRVPVTLSARVSRATARLQERSGRRWRTVAHKRLLRRTVTLSCPVARGCLKPMVAAVSATLSAG
jgi:hypothetical protein